MKLNDYSDFTKVVIIDDDYNEGNEVRKALLGVGISSAFFHISSSQPEPKGPYKNVRLVFLDLDLEHLGVQGNPTQGASITLATLSKVVDKSSHYVLVLWSAKTTKQIAKEFRRQLRRTSSVANPIKIISLGKNTCKNPSGSYNLAKIKRGINLGLESLPAFSVFSEGERIFCNAIAKAMVGISKRRSDQTLSKVINSLAKTSVPRPREKVANSALINFNGLIEDSIAREVLAHDFGDLHTKFDEEELNERQCAELNHHLIFSPDKISGSGQIVFLRKNKQFIKDVFDNEMVCLAYKFMKCFVVEVTPICGSAQSNGHRYVLHGVIHPHRRGVRNGGEIQAPKTYGYTFKDSFIYGGKICRMSFNLKSYNTDTTDLDAGIINEKLRAHIVMDIQHKIASYISRPGHSLL
jgi:hypothetical protein